MFLTTVKKFLKARWFKLKKKNNRKPVKQGQGAVVEGDSSSSFLGAGGNEGSTQVLTPLTWAAPAKDTPLPFLGTGEGQEAAGGAEGWEALNI